MIFYNHGEIIRNVKSVCYESARSLRVYILFYLSFLAPGWTEKRFPSMTGLCSHIDQEREEFSFPDSEFYQVIAANTLDSAEERNRVAKSSCSEHS